MGVNKNPIIYLVKKTWTHSEDKGKVVFYLILFFFSNIVLLLFPLLIAKIVNIIQLEGITNDTIYRILFWIFGYLGLTIAFWALHGPARVIETVNAFKVKAHYKLYLLKGVMDLPASWHSSNQSGDTIDKIEKGSSALYDFAELGFMVMASLIKLVGATLILFLFNVPSGIISLLIVFATMFIVVKFDKHIIKSIHKLNLLDNQISAKVYDTISNITTVIVLRLEKLLVGSLFTKIMHPLSLFHKNIRMKETKWFVVSMMAILMVVSTLTAYVLTAYFTGSVILIGSLMALYQYADTINNIFFHFTWQYGEIVKQKTDVENAEILAKEFRKKESSEQIILNKDNWNQISILDLNFHYEETDSSKIIEESNITVDRKKSKKVIDLHIKNIQIKKGEKIALVGESGAGKTTFLKLLRDLYTPQKSSIVLDDQKLKTGFKEIAGSISLIPQDPEIFAGTIKDNITFGIRVNKKELDRFIKLAKFKRVIPSLPNGLQSNINERGVNLSGGQKQRLALVRGLLASKDKELILLDEPTSSVDAHNEMEIYHNIMKEYSNKTVISSMHRLHLLSLFDRIFYFEKGKIVQVGTLKELLRSNRKFRNLYEKYKDAKV